MDGVGMLGRERAVLVLAVEAAEPEELVRARLGADILAWGASWQVGKLFGVKEEEGLEVISLRGTNRERGGTLEIGREEVSR